MSKSCYILELSVQAGSARRGDAFAYNQLEHIRYCLEHDLLAEDPGDRAYAASLAAGYGETIVLWIVQRGEVVRAIDLHPHIRIRVGGDPPLPLTEAEGRDEAWKDRLSDGRQIAFEIDWEAIAAAAPKLKGKLLRPGETLEIELTVNDEVLRPLHSYLEITEEIAYGYQDLEGDDPAPPTFVDPDPEETEP